MINMRTLPFALLVLVLFVFAPTLQAPVFGCAQPPGYGFKISWKRISILDGDFFSQSNASGTVLIAKFDVYDSGYQPGSTDTKESQTFGGIFSERSVADFLGLATPASWTITVGSGLCTGDVVLGPAAHHFDPSSEPVKAECHVFITGSMTINPGSYDLCQPGATEMLLASDNFWAGVPYGDPLVEMYYESPPWESNVGVLMFSGVVWEDWNAIVHFTPPWDAFIYGEGWYSIFVWNRGEDGGFYQNGGDASSFLAGWYSGCSP